MTPKKLKNYQLDLLFRIDLSAMRPYNAYGMTTEDFAARHRRQWENYSFPCEYEYVYSYIRLSDLINNPLPYVTYVQDLYYWKLQDTFPLEQGIGIITGKKLALFICDETDIERPWYKHFKLLQTLYEVLELVKNYDHSVWGYACSENVFYIQENDDLLDKGEEPVCFLVDTDELKARIKQLKKEIKDFFPILYYHMKSVIPVNKRDVLELFFSIPD